MQAKEHASVRRAVDVVGLSDDFADFATDVYDQVDVDGGYAHAGVPGVVYAAVRIKGEPVKPAEIADATDVDADRVVKDMRRMVADLPFDVAVDGIERRYVDRYVDELGVDDDFRSKAVDMCDAATDAGLHSGKAPSAFAAAVVYAASVVLDANVRQDDVADVADVSTTIIRRYYRDIIDASGGSPSVTHDDIPSIVDTIVDRLGPSASGHVGFVRDARTMGDAVDPDADWVRRCDPRAVAAAVVYVAAKRHRLDVTQAEAGEPVGISRHAVNARSQDVREWDRRRRFDGMNYNTLKQVAADNDVDVGMTPERDYLIGQLIDAGVDP